MGLCPFTRSFYGRSFIHIGRYLMDPVLPIGRYPYGHWVLGARPGGIESYRPLPQLDVLPCDRGNLGGPPGLLRFVTLEECTVSWLLSARLMTIQHNSGDPRVTGAEDLQDDPATQPEVYFNGPMSSDTSTLVPTLLPIYTVR